LEEVEKESELFQLYLGEEEKFAMAVRQVYQKE
jgi:hypothetical protein